MFDTIVKHKVFAKIDDTTYYNLGRYHKIGIYENLPPNKWDVSSKYVVVGFASKAQSLIAHSNSKPEAIKFLKNMVDEYHGN